MAIIRVPQDQDSIQSGVNAANPGDIVLVDKGFYQETVVINKDSIRLVAKVPHGVILQSNNSNENAIQLNNVNNVEIYGFIIQDSHRSIWIYRGGYHRIIGNIFQIIMLTAFSLRIPQETSSTRISFVIISPWVYC